MGRRLSIKTGRQPAITITRQALKQRRLVYVARANKRIKYPFGRSAIVYIGTTATGVGRIAASAAHQARQFLDQHGVKHLELYVVACTPLRRVQTWTKLESALLLTFKHQYGSVPLGNTRGKNQKWKDELRYFSESRLRAVLRGLST
jgi:hypothetical protein